MPSTDLTPAGPRATALHRASAGIRAWVQERARGARGQVLRMAPAAIAASLVAAALAPFAQVEVGVTGGLLAALLAQLGQVGGNYVTDALEDVIGGMRGTTPVTEAEVRDALAAELERRLGGAGTGAGGLREEMSSLLRSLSGVETALAAAFDSGVPDLHTQMARSLAELSATYAEFRGLSESVVAGLDAMQRGVTELLRGQRERADVDQRVLLEMGLLRRQIRALATRTAAADQPAPDADGSTAPDPAPGLPHPVDDRQPYRGLAAFQVHDAEWFHGREALTITLVNRLAERLPGPSLVVLVGASGAGKSSLLHAGLIPAVRDGLLAVPGSDAWPYVLMNPGASPVRDLAIRVATLATISAGSVEADLRADPARFASVVRQALLAWSGPLGAAGRAPAAGSPGRLLLVVDQFEELFTQCRDAGERQCFIRALCAAATAPTPADRPAAAVVLGLRADFYTECTAHPELVKLLEGSQVVVGPMTRDELRHAIERPAEIAGLTLEPGLVDVILHDLDARLAAGDQPGYDPGRLPLLSHALLATWERRRERRLTLAGYHAAGGIERAVTTTADRLYEELGDPERAMVRQVLLRLVVVSDSAAEDARGRVARAELLRERSPESRRAIETALQALVGARLVTATEDSFEITHEALLRAWPRLRAWIEGDREWLTVRRQLSEAAASWERGDGELYGKTRLSRVGEQIDDARRAELDHREAAFLAASEEQEARRERSERTRARVLRSLAAVLTGLLVVTGFLAAVAYSQGAAADEQRRIADSRQVAAEADALRSTDPAVAALLATRAYRIDPTTEARSSVLNSQSANYSVLRARDPGRLNGIAVSSDGRSLASAGQAGDIELWDLAAHQAHGVLRDGTGPSPVRAVAFSPDGARVAGAEENGSVELWDVQRGQPVAVLPGGRDAADTVAYSPAGDLVATAGEDGILRLWDAATGKLVRALVPVGGPVATIDDVAFSRDGRSIATAGGDGTAVVWSVDGARRVVLGQQAGPVRAVAFAPDGRTVVTGGDDGSVRLWDAVDGSPVAILAASSAAVRAVAFSADGLTVAAGTEKGTVQLWSISSVVARLPPLTPVNLSGPTAPVLGLAFAPDGTLAAAEADATIGLWDIGSPAVLLGEPAPPGAASPIAMGPRGSDALATLSAAGAIRFWRLSSRSAAPNPTGLPGALAMAIGPDGRLLAVATATGAIELWDPVTRVETLPAGGGAVEALAFSPDGQVLATAGRDGQVRLWSPRTLVGQSGDHSGPVRGIAFSPDGRTLASAGDDGTIVLSSVPSGAAVRTLTGHLGSVLTVAFSPDGARLASGSADDHVDVWDAVRGALVASLPGHTRAVTSVAFSPDGGTLASAAGDGSVRLWRVRDWTPLATLTGQADLTAVTFSPDGRTLVGADRLGTASFRSTDPEDVIRQLCAAHPALTPTQWQQYLPPDQPYGPTCP